MQRSACAALLILFATGCHPMYTTHLRVALGPPDGTAPALTPAGEVRLRDALADLDATAADFSFEVGPVAAESAADGWLRSAWRDPEYKKSTVTLSARRQGGTLDVRIQDFRSGTESPLAAGVRAALHARLVRRFGEPAVQSVPSVEHLWFY